MYQIKLRVGEPGPGVIARSVFYSIDGKPYEIIVPSAPGHVFIRVPKGSRVDSVAMRDSTGTDKSCLRDVPDLTNFTPKGAFNPVRAGSIVIESISDVPGETTLIGSLIDWDPFTGDKYVERLEQKVDQLNELVSNIINSVASLEKRIWELEGGWRAAPSVEGQNPPVPDPASASEPQRVESPTEAAPEPVPQPVPQPATAEPPAAESPTDNPQAAEPVSETTPPPQA